MPAVRSQPPHGPALIGRQQELQALAERRRAVDSGTGALVIVAGEAGGGKSRLIADFCAGLSPGEGRVAIAHCLEYIQLPFSPYLAVLSAYVQREPSIIQRDKTIAAALAHLLPELREGAQDATAPPLDKLRQFNLLVEALRLYSIDRPAVAVIEDMQWADAGTIELLLHAAPLLAHSRVLVILSYRSDALTSNQPLRSALAKLERIPSVSRLAVRALDAVHMRALLDALNKKHGLGVATINAIAQRAEGNPLFAEELFKAAVAGADVADRHLPATLQEAVRERLQGLSDTERTTLIHAAAIGRRFKGEFLAEILGKQIEDVSPALRRGIALELIAEQSNGDVYYAFTHELMRQATYRELLALEAQQLHKKIAAALEAGGADEHVTELAHHWWHAREYAKAAQYNERAGDAAFAVFAFGDAVTHYERALQSIASQSLHAAAVHEKLARALHQHGLGKKARQAALNSLAVYETAQEMQSAARVCLMLARLSGNLGDAASLEAYAQRALAFISNDAANPLFFEAHTELMRLHVAHRWNPGKAAEHMAQAQRYAGERSATAEIHFRELKSAIEACAGDLACSLADTEAAAATCFSSGDVAAAIRCWGNFGTLMVQIGERSSARLGFEHASTIIAEQRISGLTSNWTLIECANAHFLEGELERAVELLEQVLAAGIETPTFRLNLARTAIPVALALDRLELVQRCAAPGLVADALGASEPTVIGSLGAFAQYFAAVDLQAEAEQLLRDALDALGAIRAEPAPGDIDRFVVAVARHGRVDDIARARVFLERILAAANIRATAGFLALCDAAAGQRASAFPAKQARALEAVQHFEAIGWPYFAAQALELADRASEALAIYQRIAAVYDVRRLEATLSPAARRSRAKDDLTSREREIYNLLLNGNSNKIIANALTISERTVENHVSSILGKFGVTSRAELIAKSKR